MSKKVTAKAFTLHSKNGGWLGQVVLTSDGMFSAVTDYGNMGYAWRSTGDENIEDFILRINIDYFAGKMFQGMSYVVHTATVRKVCERFAKEILPVLQEEIKKQRISVNS